MHEFYSPVVFRIGLTLFYMPCRLLRWLTEWTESTNESSAFSHVTQGQPIRILHLTDGCVCLNEILWLHALWILTQLSCDQKLDLVARIMQFFVYFCFFMTGDSINDRLTKSQNYFNPVILDYA